jgi:hypothetical protein
MRIFTLAAAVIGAVCCISITAGAVPNLVKNGNFAASDYTHNNQFGTGYGGQGVHDWTGNDGYSLYMYGPTSTTKSAASQYDSGYGHGSEMLYGPSGGVAPPGGGNFVVLDGDQTAGIQAAIMQTITGLIPGLIYRLNFDWGAGQLQSRTGDTTEQLQVTFGSETKSTPVVSNPSHGFTGWMSQSLEFTAASATQVLTFLSVGTPNGLPPVATLANVSMYQVPEPMTLALLGSGLAGLVATRRRKRRG